MSRATTVRIGGHLVVESLEALGAEVAFGLPGIHALAIWEALRTSEIRDLAFRTELNAGFAADGYARVSGRPAPLILSTGPGALISLASLMEAASSHVPVVAIASQIPSALLGGGRGYLHELPDQRASFAPIVKWAGRPEDAESIPATLTEAWRHASTPPTGPVFVEIPVDFLTAETELPPVEELNAAPGAPPRADRGRSGPRRRDPQPSQESRHLGGRWRDPLGCVGRAASGRRAASGPRCDDVHGQGRVP